MTGFHLESNPILELTFRLKIRDVMSTVLITAGRRDTLRTVQELMKKNSITGVPIVDGRRLLGIISVDDIIRALDEGFISDVCEAHMSRQLIVLEDDMPLSIGIGYFEKYHFGRFPVLTKDNELVGIVTSRDILTSLLVEMNKEMEELEGRLHPEKEQSAGNFHREYQVTKFDFEHAGIASGDIKKTLKEKGLDPKNLRRAAVASYEMEMNMIVHSEGGVLTCDCTPDRTIIMARDRGPGIRSIEDALTEGWTTATDWIRTLGFGAGMGLPNIRRVSDEFDIQSSAGCATTVRSVILHPGFGTGEKI